MKRLMLTTLISALAAGICMADVPPILNHQGMLTDSSGIPLSGDHYMIFKLYDVPTGGTELWGEAQLVTVTNGVFNVYLGEVAYLDEALFVGQDIWVGVTVEDDAEMTPRLRIGSVLYAFTASNQAATGDLWYEDADGDGYGNPNVWVTSLTQPVGYVINGADCNDGADYINPGAEEFCDGIDYNCDGQDAEGLVGPLCDFQAGVCAGTTMTCGGVLGWLPCGPGDYGPYFEAVEITCDGLDNDCDGVPDDGVNCDDGNSCTSDDCLGIVGCSHEPLAGNDCDDGNPCTTNDVCDGIGNCVGTPVICDDGNPCTMDYCDPVEGCVYIPQDQLCDDGIPCTNDYCDGGSGCVNEVQPNMCVIDGQCYFDGDNNPLEECLECNPATNQYGWTSLPNGTACSGGECSDGICTPLFR